MTDKELDDLFKKSFEAHKLRLPSDMWQRVQPKKETKRRGAILWWTGLGAALLLFSWGAATLFFTAPSVVNKKTVAASSLQKKAQQQTIIKPAQKASSVKNNTVVNGRDSSDLLIVKQSAQKENKNSKHLLSAKKNEAKNKTLPVIESSSFDKEKKSQPKNLSGAKNNVLNSNIINKTNNDTAEKGINAIGEEAQAEKSKRVDSITNITPKKATVAKAEEPMITIKKMGKKRSANLELMTAGYTGSRHVYGIENNTPPSFVSLNDPQEKTVLHSISVNMRIEKPISKNISFKTGLQFLQTHQSISYNEEEVNLYASVNTLSVRADTTRFTQISFHRPNLASVYNSLNIPLLLSYQTAGTSLNVGASAGVVVNLVSWYKGEVPDGNYQKTLSANNAFRLNSGASLYLSFYAAKSLGKWQLFAEPDVQYTLSSLTKNNVAFKQKITNYGVGIGIRKRLGK